MHPFRSRLAATAWVIAWLGSVAVSYLSLFGILQTAIGATLRGAFRLDGSRAEFAWFGIPNWGWFPGVGWLILLAIVGLALTSFCGRAVVLKRNVSLSVLRLSLSGLALSLALLSLLGLLEKGSGFASLMRGDFRLSNHPVSVFWLVVSDVHWLWGGLILAGFVATIYFEIAYQVHVKRAGRDWENTLQDDVDDVLVAAQAMRVSAWQRTVYMAMLNDPTRHIERIKEKPDQYARSITVTTRYTLNFGDSVPDEAVVPLLLAKRGQLQDGLQVSIADLAASPFSYVNSSAFALAVIRSSIRAAGGSALTRYQAARVPTSAAGSTDSLEHRVAEYLASSEDEARLDAVASQKRTQQFSLVAKDLMDLSAHAREEPPLFEAVKTFGELRTAYPITVAIPAHRMQKTARGTVVRATVVRRLTTPLSEFSWRAIRDYVRRPAPGQPNLPSRLRRRDFRRRLSTAAEASLTRATDQLRHWFGVRSNIVRHELGNAARTKSYHLELVGPADSYMARQQLYSPRQSGLLVRTAVVQSTSASSNGQRHAHLYVRNGQPIMSKISYEVAFFERTPGSMAVAFVAAGSALLLSIILAVRQLDVLHRGDAQSDPSGLLQILLAFPVATAAAGTLLAGRSPWGGVLAARLANALTFLFSLSALWVSVLPATFSPSSLPRVWLAIVGGLAITTVACGGSWIMRVFVHARFVDQS